MADQQYINAIIAKANGKDKVIDFRDGLVPANTNDYAMIHGAGGAKHAPNSVVKVTVCDFSKGKGDKSVTVSANISTETVAMLHAAAQKFLINPPSTQQTTTPSGLVISQADANKISESLQMLVNASKARKIEGDDFVALGTNIRAVYNSLKNAPAPQQKKSGGKDFEYSQERVNAYRQGKDGLAADFAPVNKLSITHQSVRDDGAVSRYPWVVKITNGFAQVKKDANGATSYIGSTFKLSAEAFIMLADADMFRMMEDCVRFIRAWELAYGIPVIKAGEAAREEARKNAASNNDPY